MADISKITLPSGTTYNIKDETARDAIAGLTSFEYVICTDASNTPQGVSWKSGNTTITGTLAPASGTKGKIYLVPSQNGTKDIYDEYMTIGSGSSFVWEMFGNTDVHLDDLGELAYKNSASGAYKPEGTVSQPTFTGNKLTSTGKVVTAGTITTPTFSGNSGNVSVTGVPEGNISVGNGTANYTPEGSITAPTVTVNLNSTTKYVASSATGGGTVTAGTAATCQMPVLETTVTGETLTINWTEGDFEPNTPTAVTLPSFTNQTIATGVNNVNVTEPSFTGEGVQLKFTGASTTSTGTFTPSGTVSQPDFNGEEVDVTVSGTPTGTVSQPTFNGTSKTVTVS